MLRQSKRRVSFFGIALSIMASMTLLLIAALVSAREPPKAASLALPDENPSAPSDTTPPVPPTDKPSEPTKAAPAQGRRLPLCQGFRAKIVSQNSRPELSIASPSYDGKGTALARLGSHIDGHRVVAIGYDGDRVSPSVVLSDGKGLCQAMTFEKPEMPSTRATRSSRTRPVRSGHTEVLVDRSAVDSILERAFELTRGVQLVPEFKDGSIAGVRLIGIQRGTLLSALGLENGDSVMRINGQALTTPEAAMSFYSRIRSFERFDIEVNRAGKLAHIEIRIS